MIITVEALKELYTSLGGELTDTYDSIANGLPVSDYNVIPDMIQALAQKTGGGSGSSLPAVTSDDNGKLLTVVEGAWDKADPSGGGAGIFKVTITANDSDITANKTFAEIAAAINNGSIVMLDWDRNTAEVDTVLASTNNIQMDSANLTGNNLYVSFAHILIGDGEATLTKFIIYSSDTVVIQEVGLTA